MKPFFSILLLLQRITSIRFQSPFLQYKTPTPPILLLPGMGGSRLMLNNKIMYPPKLIDYISNFQVWKEQIKHNKDIGTLPFGDKKSLDLQTSVKIFNIQNKYDDLMKEPNVFPIPYDFRRIDDFQYLDIFFTELKTYIEKFRCPINAICHSSGGLIMHYFLHNQTPEWKENYIDTITNVNVPFGGIPLILELCTSNETTLTRMIGTDLFRSIGASVINIPNSNCFSNVLTVNNEPIPDFLSYFGLDDIKKKREHIQPILDTFIKSTDVNTHIIYSNSTQKNTVIGFTKTGNTIHKIYGYGDDVVPIDSLLVPKLWDNQDKLTFRCLWGLSHSNIFYPIK